jgi:hypothetical protein
VIKNIWRYLNIEFRSISKKSKYFFYLSLATSFFCALLDLVVAYYFSKGFGPSAYLVVGILIFGARAALTCLANFFILSFSFSVEIDKKVDAIYLDEDSSQRNGFSNVSFNVAHNSFTGVVRLANELLILSCLIVYILFWYSGIAFILVLGAFVCFPALYLLLVKTRRYRKLASIEQSKFLAAGMELINVNDRAKELNVQSFLRDRLLSISENYSVANRSSLFYAQSMKPIFEFLCIMLLAGVSLVHTFEAGVLYLGYRLVGSVNVFIGSTATILHYYSQYLNTYKSMK